MLCILPGAILQRGKPFILKSWYNYTFYAVTWLLGKSSHHKTSWYCFSPSSLALLVMWSPVICDKFRVSSKMIITLQVSLFIVAISYLWQSLQPWWGVFVWSLFWVSGRRNWWRTKRTFAIINPSYLFPISSYPPTSVKQQGLSSVLVP